ncbi:hypothetical protein O181_118026 [Austropuccinia psidii MF-1]|uniref:Uncharacterized protein n=1 Tax=Austropuccinia psidii MF-1 TaxID=1389203 RepID=A0A9Q3KD28_9BASI|nr:hypothetical protein [Austropuccinia psidii MF-1]
MQKFNDLTLDINDFKKNDRTFAEWYKVTDSKIESIYNTCDKIERKFQVQNDELEDLSITKIHDQLEILKTHAVEIVDNTNIFATNLARSDSQRQKLKNEVIEHVEKVHKNYEPNAPMPKNSTPFTEEKLLVKESLSPFLGENEICKKDILKLE